MIDVQYHMIVLLALLTVPISWAVPRRYAFDAVAAWTALVLFILSPATALWLIAITIGLPLLLRGPENKRGPVTFVLCVVLVAGLVASRGLPGWAWIGGAFFTLRGLHVTLEWWMGRMNTPTLRESVQYFLYLPVIAAGPINRMPHFQHQLRRRRWEMSLWATGAERVLLGLIWFYVVSGYGMPKVQGFAETQVDGLAEFYQLWSASALSWVNLFFAFAGSTHIALGIALMSGLRLEENFDRPWAARDLIDFWTRWHMTLTNWVRDYVFSPITALTRQPIIGLLLAMLVIGLWHEFSLYYVLWAMWQSLGIVLSRLMLKRLGDQRLPTLVGSGFVLAWLSAARPVMAMVGVSS